MITYYWNCFQESVYDKVTLDQITAFSSVNTTFYDQIVVQFIDA